jgi:hypothetical protein
LFKALGFTRVSISARKYCGNSSKVETSPTRVN